MMHHQICRIALTGMIMLLIGFPLRHGHATEWVDSYDRLLNKYVSNDGVRYRLWKGNASDLIALENVVNAIGIHEINGAAQQEKLAFYLNAYNAWILYHILQDYPTGGPGGGGFFGRNRFFKSRSIVVAGEKLSFQRLENQRIRSVFREPRIHFALNCDSTSCPPLLNRAFQAESLNEDLDSLTRAFLNHNPNGVQLDHQNQIVYLSKLFDWFEDDFSLEQGGDTRSFINSFRNSAIPTNYKIKYLKYDWSLNSMKPEEGR